MKVVDLAKYCKANHQKLSEIKKRVDQKKNEMKQA